MATAEAERAGQEPEGPPDSGFLIDGEWYEIPSLYSFDMDENKIMYDLSGTPTEDWMAVIEAAKAEDVTPEQAQELARRIQNPGFLRAAVHIAYRRAHPDSKHDDIEVTVGRSNHITNWAAMFLGGGEAEDPTSGTTSTPTESSPSVPDSSKPTTENSNEKPGTSLRNDSERPDETPAPIGTGGSDTSSRRWGRIRSVA